MSKNSNGRLIRTSDKQEFIYIRQGIVYFIYCIKEDERSDT
ncbi:MAG TPA: hypothetical protein OIM42_04850 [Clostridiaceae bacterium]|jgi:hypothetical protein|nr:hypothetical protein [Clostridiaceae bacterium]